MKKSPFQELLDLVPSSLETILAKRRLSYKSPSDQDKEIIGELLYALHDVEGCLDGAILWWVFPVANDPLRGKFEEFILSKVDLRFKIEFAHKVKLLNDEQKRQFHTLQNKRNELAHRRVEGSRPHEKFTESDQKEFLKKKDKLVKDIQKNLDDNFSTRLVEFIKAMPLNNNSNQEVSSS